MSTMRKTAISLVSWILTCMAMASHAASRPLRPVFALAAAPDGSAWVASRSLVVHLDARGRELGRLDFPAPAKVSLDGLAVTRDALWISGWFEARLPTSRGTLLPTGSPTGFVGAWDPRTMKPRWILRLGTGGAVARRLAVAPDGSAWVVGGVRGPLGVGPAQPAHGDADAFALHLSATGAVLHALRFGTPGQDQARGVAVGPDGSVAIVGQYGGPTERNPSGAVDPHWALSVGPVHLAHHGDDDGFVLVLDTAGRVLDGAALAEPGFDVVKDIRPVPGGWVAVGSMKRAAGAAGHIGGAAPLAGFVGWLDARGHVLHTTFPAGVLSVHALAADGENVWAAGHAGHGHIPSDAVLFRIGPDSMHVIARCSGASGATLGYGVAAGRSVWFGGIADAPVRCSGARQVVKGWALFRLDPSVQQANGN